ncbi:hypothetical protein OESDEN_07790 [Oesophagostomum dentatum]|uniref:Uncharacterized protein n=1 Tax=Oesophagostomum dentatum TaxID=61180 RepID=A0A0B1T847_OESDE|nr:hypothetical protein OESDEN_07790 [Oesophagostomum dentatum]
MLQRLEGEKLLWNYTDASATNDQEDFDRVFIDQQQNITVNPDEYGPLKSTDELDPTLVANLRQMGYRRLLPLQERTNYPLILIIGNTNNLMEQTFKFACTMAGYEPERRSELIC